MSVESSVSAFLSNTQNTHAPAVLASAARMILALRTTFTDDKVEDMSPQECTWLSETLETFLSYSEEELAKSMEDQASISSAPPLFSKGMRGMMNFLQILLTLRSEPRYQGWRTVVICIQGIIKHGGQDEWTKNSLHHEDGSVSVVDASLREVLNLVCFASLDEKQSPEDQKDRVDSLFQCLLNSKWKENESCFGGIQHDLLFILNGWRGILFIEDTLAFLIDTARVFLNRELIKAIPDLSSRQAFLFNWLRGPTQPVCAWLTAQSGALQETLISACRQHGLDPRDKKIDDLIENLINLSPTLEDFPEASCIENIRNLQTLGKAKKYLEATIHARNITLGHIQEQIVTTTQPTPALLQAWQSFMELEEALQLLVKYGRPLIFVEVESEEWQQAVGPDFDLGEASKALRESLTLEFERFPEVNLETIRQLKAAIDTPLLELEQRLNSDLIENFFVQTSEVQNVQLNSFYEHREQYILTEAILARWISENSEPHEAAVVALSPYEINRILLHALLEEREHWTEIFKSALKMVLAWFKRDDLTPIEKSFRAAYPLGFLFSLDMLEVCDFSGIGGDFITFAQEAYTGELGDRILGRMLKTHGDFPEAMFPHLKYYLQYQERPADHEWRIAQERLLLLSWCGLAAEQKDPELYLLAQSQLNQRIITCEDLLRVVCHEVTLTQREKIFDAVQDRWNALISNGDDLVTALKCAQIGGHEETILDATQDRWDQMITNWHELVGVLLKTHYQSRFVDFFNCQNRWDKLMRNVNDLAVVLNLNLTVAQKDKVLNATQDRWDQMITNNDELVRVFKCRLNADQKSRFFDFFNHQNRWDKLIRNVDDLVAILECTLTWGQEESILDAILDRWDQVITNGREWVGVLLNTRNIHKFIDFFNCPDRWNALITNSDDLIAILRSDLTPAQKDSILNATQDRWDQLIPNDSVLTTLKWICGLMPEQIDKILSVRSRPLLPQPASSPKVSAPSSHFHHAEDQHDEDESGVSTLDTAGHGASVSTPGL